MLVCRTTYDEAMRAATMAKSRRMNRIPSCTRVQAHCNAGLRDKAAP